MGEVPKKQFSPEERNAICMAYEKHKGKFSTYKLIIEEFSAKFPQSKVPNNSTVIRIWKMEILWQIFEFSYGIFEGDL